MVPLTQVVVSRDLLEEVLLQLKEARSNPDCLSAGTVGRLQAVLSSRPTDDAVKLRSNDALETLRSNGWSVAVHNDYRLSGESMTFWLFMHASGRWAKGEGATDAEALRLVLKQAGLG